MPDGFRFAVKLPKAITHERRLIDCRDLLDRFGDEITGLGEKRGPVLVQLPPSLTFDARVARSFFDEARDMLSGQLACEPRHPSWFGAEAGALLADARIARVAADPAIVPEAAEPGGWPGFGYFRLHGSPRIYWSDYPAEAIAQQGEQVRRFRTGGGEVWTIFDNTAEAYAPANALALVNAVAR